MDNSRIEKNHTQRSFLGVSIFVGIVVAFSVGFYVGNDKAIQNTTPSNQNPASIPADVDFSPVWKAWNMLNEKYVSATTTVDTSNEERVWGMIQGLASSLGDPYTVFFPPAE
ncbi:MAG: hypothetical protein WEB94_01700, partial [Candidatus Paceibacterota bacterium]